MQQKTTWMRYLTTGVVISLILIFANCSSGEIDYILNVDIIYKNKSNQPIKYYELIGDEKRLLFDLLPDKEKKIEIRGDGSTSNQTINNCCNDILGDFQGSNSILISYNNNTKCIIYNNNEGSGTGNITDYESRTISERYYELTYTFTEEEYSKSENCN